VTEPLCLTDLFLAEPSLRRAVHGYATAGSLRRILLRAVLIMREVVTALPRDFMRWMRGAPFVPVRMEPGEQPHAGATRVGLYVHYSASGRVSDMVRCQLDLLGQLGFAVVFISMASGIPEEDWQAVRRLCALVVQRRNFGLDFGAWRDLMPEVHRRWPVPEELCWQTTVCWGRSIR